MKPIFTTLIFSVSVAVKLGTGLPALQLQQMKLPDFILPVRSQTVQATADQTETTLENSLGAKLMKRVGGNLFNDLKT